MNCLVNAADIKQEPVSPLGTHYQPFAAQVSLVLCGIVSVLELGFSKTVQLNNTFKLPSVRVFIPILNFVAKLLNVKKSFMELFILKEYFYMVYYCKVKLLCSKWYYVVEILIMRQFVKSTCRRQTLHKYGPLEH